MKALSLWQPWASLIAVGAKRYETRGWSTSYRGPLLICASVRKLTREDFVLCCHPEFQEALRPFGLPIVKVPCEPPMQHVKIPYYDARGLILGAVVCLADITDCIPTEHIAFHDGHREQYFGNFAPGRFAWRLDNVRALPAPIPVKGRQGLWVPGAEVQAEVGRQLVGESRP